jgi:hypothetical protein
MQAGPTIPEGALAIIVVPPLKPDPLTKVRPKGLLSSYPPDAVLEEQGNTQGRAELPISSIISSVSVSGIDGTVQPVSHGEIPIYNGVPLFPDRSQRAALHSLLKDLVRHERKVKQRAHSLFGQTSSEVAGGTVRTYASGDEKASHAFLFGADADTMRRADTIPLAIALWRLRMFEGQGWESSRKWYYRRKYLSTSKFET